MSMLLSMLRMGRRHQEWFCVIMKEEPVEAERGGIDLGELLLKI